MNDDLLQVSSIFYCLLNDRKWYKANVWQILVISSSIDILLLIQYSITLISNGKWLRNKCIKRCLTMQNSTCLCWYPFIDAVVPALCRNLLVMFDDMEIRYDVPIWKSLLHSVPFWWYDAIIRWWVFIPVFHSIHFDAWPLNDDAVEMWYISRYILHAKSDFIRWCILMRVTMMWPLLMMIPSAMPPVVTSRALHSLTWRPVTISVAMWYRGSMCCSILMTAISYIQSISDIHSYW
jgi:hypothetical protein